MTAVRIVEDSEILAEMLGAILSLESIPHVSTTHNFQNLLDPEAWQGITHVLCDLNLTPHREGVNGPEILAYLREHHPEIKRIVLSATADVDRDRTLLDGLADVILQKPTDLPEIIGAIMPADGLAK